MFWFFVVVLVCCLMEALGVWFWVLAIALGALAFFLYEDPEKGMTEEEKAEHRRLKRERNHAEQMIALEEHRLRRQLQIEAEEEAKRRKSAAMGGIGAAVAKVGVGLAINALTGGNHKHRH